MRFFVGLAAPSHAKHFAECFLSINPLWERKSGFEVKEWILDSGGFTEIMKYGEYRHSVAEYAAKVKQLAANGTLLAAVSQDYICDPDVLRRTGLTLCQHQTLSVTRYLDLRERDCGTYIMPVLQGQSPASYVAHLRLYGNAITPHAWVGVGSIVKRSKNPRVVEAILLSIYRARPDLRLHAFGLKTTALLSGTVRRLLFSADSIAWSFAARMSKRGGANDWREAYRFRARINAQQPVVPLFSPDELVR